MRKVKIFSVFMSIILLCSTLLPSVSVSAAFTPKFALHSEGVYMVNLDTDIVIVSKNADKKLTPASTTKIMTALVALENIKDFNAKVVVNSTATDEFWSGNPNYEGPSTADIRSGQENVTYWDCLYALMVCSACEAGNILAVNIAGSIPDFVAMMNAKAAEIGCTGTHFANTHGLYSEDNYTTARDLYLITRYAMDNYPGFMTICSTTDYKMPANSANPDGYTIHTTNHLMVDGSYYYEGVEGVKTGSINEYYEYKDGAWDTANPKKGSMALVTTCKKKGSDDRGYRYMIVTLGAPYYDENGDKSNYSFKDHIALYDWAFSEFVYTNIVKMNEQVTQVDVKHGKDVDKVGICAAEDYYTLLEKSLNKTTVSQNVKLYSERVPIQAPQNKGYEVGELELKLNDETLATVKLITESDLELDTNAFYMEKIGQVVANPLFKWLCVLVGVELVLLIVTHYMKQSFRRKVEAMNRRRRISMNSPKKRKY